MLDEHWVRKILGRFYSPSAASDGERKEMTRKEREHRKARTKMARASRRRNR